MSINKTLTAMALALIIAAGAEETPGTSDIYTHAKRTYLQVQGIVSAAMNRQSQVEVKNQYPIRFNEENPLTSGDKTAVCRPGDPQ